MSREEKREGNKRYYSIIGGTLRTQVPPTHPDAVPREWETKDGKSGTKYERETHALFGNITDVQFHDGDYGKNINITLDPDDDGMMPIISVGVATRYGEDFLKKLPAIDLTREVRIRPFSFVPEGEENTITGVEITQKDDEDKFKEKVLNFFWDAENKKPKNGYPEVDFDKDGADSDDWKMYYTKARKYMIRYSEEHVLPVFAAKESFAKEQEDEVEYPSEEAGETPF